DLSNVTGLTEISLPDNSEIKELTIKESKTLTIIDVSNSSIEKLNTNGCSKLEILNCESCNITKLNVSGCEKLLELNCAYNCLARLDVSELKNLGSLKCDHQVINGVRRLKRFNFIDFLFGIEAEIFATSDYFTDELEKVKDLKALDKNGEDVLVNLDKNTGEISFSEAPAAIKYNYETGFKNILMDVTVKTTASGEEGHSDDKRENNNGSGGCNSGVTNFALSCCLAFFLCIGGCLQIKISVDRIFLPNLIKISIKLIFKRGEFYDSDD
ncbi:MAG: hypothetical protein IJ859_07040, partial [Synergistaceae bacterium]|nr:hypothetical protein [Synergistaceae bacterium]